MKEKKSFKKSTILFIGIGVLGVAIGLIIGGIKLFEYMDKKSALNLVQNGYMGRYNTVTTKLVLEDFPREQESAKWSVEYKDINDEERIVVKFAYNDTNYIKFLPSKDRKTYKVFAMKGADDKISTEDFSDNMDDLYINYMERHPEKGVNVDVFSNAKESDWGKKGKIAKVKNGELFKVDIQACLNNIYYLNTVKKLNLVDKGSDVDNITYGSSKSNLLVGIMDEDSDYDDEAVINIWMTISGSQNLAPSFCGIRMGDTIEKVKKVLKSNESFVFKEDKEVERRINKSIYSFEGGTLSIKYRTNNNDKIFDITYIKQFSASDFKALGYTKCNFLPGESDSQKESGIQNTIQYIFPDSDSKYLSEDEIRSVEADKLMIGRNEIFARHGRIFEDQSLIDHFSAQSWYNGSISPDDFNSDAELNDFEKKNVELIKKVEDEVNGSANTPVVFSGMTGKYQCGSDIDSGVIDVYAQDGVFNIAIGTQRMPAIIGGVGGGMPGTISDANTGVVDWGSCRLTLTWSGKEEFTITRSGNTGTPEVDDVTNNVTYYYAGSY